MGVARGVVDSHPHATKSTPMRASPPRARRPRIKNLMEMVRKRIHEDTPQSHGGPGSFILGNSDSPLSKKITSHRSLKKFVIPSFDCYTGVTDPFKHLRAYQVKMVVHSHDNRLMCRVFPSSLKGTALDWLYSLLSWSLWNFEVGNTFFSQYASRQEFKRNNKQLLTIKMKPGETLKRYISYFKNQMAFTKILIKVRF